MAWIFLGGQREGATAAKVPPTHHTRVTVQAGPEEPRAQKIHTHQQKSLVFYHFHLCLPLPFILSPVPLPSSLLLPSII